MATKTIKVDNLPSRILLSEAIEFLQIAKNKLGAALNLPEETEMHSYGDHGIVIKTDKIDFVTTEEETVRVQGLISDLRLQIEALHKDVDAFEVRFEAWRV